VGLVCQWSIAFPNHCRYLQNVGHVQRAIFPTQQNKLAKKKLVYITSSQNIFAALNTRTGNIEWRRVFNENIDLLKSQNGLQNVNVQVDQ
jgi:glucose dehydrogenase